MYLFQQVFKRLKVIKTLNSDTSLQTFYADKTQICQIKVVFVYRRHRNTRST